MNKYRMVASVRAGGGRRKEERVQKNRRKDCIGENGEISLLRQDGLEKGSLDGGGG